MNKNNTPNGKSTLIHNPGDDFKELVYWMNEEKPHIAPYFIPVLALLGTCFAIEGYINMVGQHVDQNWKESNKGPVPLKDLLKQIYLKIDKDLMCGEGIWQDVLKLFKMRINLVHPEYKYQKENGTSEIPDIFDKVSTEYSPERSKEILEETIDVLLKDTGLTHLKDIGTMKGYSGPIRKK